MCLVILHDGVISSKIKKKKNLKCFQERGCAADERIEFFRSRRATGCPSNATSRVHEVCVAGEAVQYAHVIEKDDWELGMHVNKGVLRKLLAASN